MIRTVTVIVLPLLLILSLPANALSGPVPDTGQTQSYTETFGEDADYTINPPSYTKLDASGNDLPDEATEWVMVRDNVTGLIWEVKTDDESIHDRDNTYTWCDNNPDTNGGNAGTCGDGTDTEDFISVLNAENFGGFSDWRLPAREELRSIADDGRYNPSISPDYFRNTISSSSTYWSSSTYASNVSDAWHVWFDNGSGGRLQKYLSHYVRAVRGGQSQSSGALVINRDGTVTDTDTGLMWQQATASNDMIWEDALSYCENLSLGGYDDWRLPNIKELASLLDLARLPTIDPAYLYSPDTVSPHCWSSTTIATHYSGAWLVDFNDGHPGANVKWLNSHSVRAVRGGQKQIESHLLISEPVQASIWHVGESMPITWETQDIAGNVRVSISRDGGKTYEDIVEATENDGTYEWVVTLPQSVNCTLIIEPIGEPEKGATQGLFSIYRDLVGDNAIDTDSDGLSDLQEFHANTDPNNHDTDNDGMPDIWELGNALKPNTDDANGDHDQDGSSNIREFQNGTDPQDSRSHRSLIPEAGQEHCYDVNGDLMDPCPSPGDYLYGQDANYTINPQAYTKLNSQGEALPDSAAEWLMVRDDVTGLVWEVKQNQDGAADYADPNDADNTYTWHDSNIGTNGGYAGVAGNGTDTEDFIQALNDSYYGGYNDWRVPSARELSTIDNQDGHLPPIDTNYFPNMVPYGFYWSSSTNIENPEEAWRVIGYSVLPIHKSNEYGIRAVRGGTGYTSSKLVDNTNGTLTDASTGFMWQYEAAPQSMYWESALSYCETLSLGGHNDWRLPNKSETQSLIDYDDDLTVFPDHWADMTSTGVNKPILVTEGGGIHGHPKTEFVGYVRCVRAGQNQKSGSLLVLAPQQASAWRDGDNVTITWDTKELAGDVSISISRDGGVTYEDISQNTENDGAYYWTVTGPASVNCMLKIEPIGDPSRGTMQGLFAIDIDSDSDGMLDAWETSHFGDLSHDGTADSDADSLNDLQEYQSNTDPNQTDSDGDGMLDGWEVSNSLDPNADDTGEDADGDEFTNGREYQDQTDPYNRASHLILPEANSRIPDTGQTQCYDDGGETACPREGETFHGQDASYTINPPSYIKMDAQGRYLADSAMAWTMVRDNVTGLVWEVKTDDGSIHDRGNTFTWCDSNPDMNGGDVGTCGSGTDTQDFIETLNSEDHGGFSDWRLPTREELYSIVDYGRHNPAIDTAFFPDTISSYYRTSTTWTDSNIWAWHVDFNYGYDTVVHHKSDSYYVRAVRGGQSRSLDHSVINGDGTVTDTDTGLMWQQGTAPSEMNWQDAISYCENLALGGNDGWRLPNIKELDSLVDINRHSPAIDTGYFPDTASSRYWSSTTLPGSTSYAWHVYLYYSAGANYGKSISHDVRAVRGGQPVLPDHLVISAPQQADHLIVGKQMPITWETESIAGNVKITLSRDGGKTFETVSESTENDGSYTWTVAGAASVNCVMKIEPLDDPPKGTSQGLFTIAVASAPPYTPSSPSPAHRRSYVSVNADLSWTGGDKDTGDTVIYDVYFGTSSIPPLVASDQSVNTYEPGTLTDSTLYYWKVVAKDTHGLETEGPVWSFDTGYDPAGDSDSDGMMDNWEGTHFNDLGHTGGADTDADGLTDLQEYQYDTSPNNDDSDGDGMPDGWELNSGLDPTVDDSGVDSDGDRFTDGREYQDQTDLYDSSSHLVLPEATGRIPDTGQTKCYDDSAEIACPQEGGAFYGQDANYTINPPSYMKMDSQGNYLSDSATSWVMVRDNVTGFIWEVKTDDGSIHDRDDTYTWCDNNPDTNVGDAGKCGDGTDTEDFINALNSENFGGFSDWHLATLEELRSIVDYGRSYPATNPDYFPNTVDSYYWSSTTNVGNTIEAWQVHFSDGGDGDHDKSSSNYARAVRGGQFGSFDVFIPNHDGTVTDAATGLMWQQAASTNTINWQSALSYCEDLDRGGYTDWRLPNIKELASLADLNRWNPAIDTDYFPNTVDSYYWSSTANASGTSDAWNVNFLNGDDHNFDKSDSYDVRAVRGGQNQIPGNLYITSPLQASIWSISDTMPITWETQEISGNVRISISRDGGKSFDVIEETTENDGTYAWTVAGPGSVNCMLRVEPIDDLSKGTTQGLFSIDTDSDSDGMYDDWEIINFGDLSHDGTGDTESDGLTDLQEYQNNTDPNNSDSDEDGMLDGWEVNNNLNPNVNNSGDDPDGDKFTNGREYQDQTDPNNSGSHLILQSGAIPDTGQTKCYNNSSEITCPSSEESFYGQDGNYTINPPAYIKMDDQGNYLPDSATSWTMVKDIITGLIWEVKTDDDSVHDKDNTYTWCDANSATNGGNAGTCGDGTDTEDFINTLNGANFGGFSDWRLPTREELRSVVDYGRHDPAIDTAFFLKTVSSYYWSSTTYANDTYDAWVVSFYYGDGGYNYKSTSYCVRAVRGGQSRLLDHLAINDDGTVTDTDTGMMWQQATSATMNWQSALSYCEDLDLGGYTDWRLPNIKELASLADLNRYSPAIDTDYFPDTVSPYYWSSTTRADSPGDAWRVRIDYGYDGSNNNKSDGYDVRAVRGGQNSLFGHLVIAAPNQASDWNIGEAIAISWDTQDISGNVKVSISRDGGKTYEVIVENTENDGGYEWPITGSASLNCMLRIEPIDDPSKGTTQGLFSIDTDSDSDGMLDNWETMHFGDLSYDGTADTDGDGLSDLLEYTNHTDPNGSDSDADGMDDYWEVDHGLNPTMRDSAEDPDGDRFTNGREYQDQTDPSNPVSHLILPVATGRIPDTGRVKCHDDASEIECPQEGESFYGQDASYSINPFSYIKMDAQGNYLHDNASSWAMVRDNVTGLIWEIKKDDESIHDKDNTYGWQDAQDLFIDELNATTFGGQSDWRLPSIMELVSTANLRYDLEGIDTAFFPNTLLYHWSSTTYVKDSDFAWSMLHGGPNINVPKVHGHQVRAVRGEQLMSSGSLMANIDGTVTDSYSGLTWQVATAPEAMTWQEALSYCEELTLAEYSDWRLPNQEELRSITDYELSDPIVDTDYFEDTYSSYYWSSTPYAADTAMLIDFGDGQAHVLDKSAIHYVRAVRGGQKQTLDNLTISTPNQASLWIAGQSMPITWDVSDIEGNVRISVSRAGGKDGTFETIAEDTENDGSYDWSVSGPSSADCVIRIEPLTDLSKANSVGLFTIDLVTFGYIIADPVTNLQEYDLSFIAIHEILGERQVEPAWSLSDPDLADIDGNVLTAKGNGCVTVTVDYAGREYRELICLKAGFDQMETESNNTLLTSTDLTEGRFMEGELLYEDVDYYRVDIPSDSIIEISYTSESHSADVGIEVFDGSDNLLATAVSVDGESLLFPLGLVAGDYYVKLTPAGDIDQSGIYDVVYGIYAVLPRTGAAHIAFDETREGRISHLQDAREYTFELDREEVGISFVPSTHTIDYHIEIRKDEELVQEIDTVPGESFEIESLTGSGSYSLLVTSGQVIDAASSFFIRITKKNLVEDEPNDIYQAATDFFIGEEIKGWLGGGDDTDFYTLRTSAPVYVDLLFECYGCGIEHDIEVYKDSDQNLINGIKIGDGESTTLTMGLGIGRYYLKIAAIPADDDTAYPYSLTLSASAHNDLEIESNNTYRFANPISKEETIKGRIFADADTDYFGFYLPEFTVFMVDFTAASTTADYRLSLVDKDGNEFYYKTSSDGEAMTLRANRPAGTYFVNIQSNGDIDLYNDYELVLRTDAEINPGNQIIGENNIVSLSVNAPSGSIAVDEEVQLTATGHYQDTTSGTVENVVWSCLDPDIASISGAGVLTGITDGYATIVGIHGWLTGQFTLMIGNPVQAVSQHYGNLILVAGGGVEASNTLKESTQYLSDLVYLRFQNRLFADDDIYYFNPILWHDIDGDGYGNDIVDDASPTVTEFGQSVTQWAAEQSTNGPLYIYLIDHGGVDTFKIFPNEIMTAVQLDDFIDTFQAATNRQVVVMIEACKSGSFTDDLVGVGQDRIAVTCTNNQDAYMQLQGRISFTQFFVDRLLTGDSIQNGYRKATAQLSNMGLPYSKMVPQLVDGVSLASTRTMLGGDFVIASLFPEITGQSPGASITADAPQAFYAEISDLEGIDSVWAVVLTPDYIPPSTAEDLEAPDVGLPTFDLTDPDKDGRYEGTYSEFIYNGEYRVTFYARNENGNVTASPATIITVTGGQDVIYLEGDVNGDGDVTLSDAIAAMRAVIGVDTTGESIILGSDVNGDNRVGLSEVIYIIQKVVDLHD